MLVAAMHNGRPAIFRMQSREVAVLWHDCHWLVSTSPIDCSRLVLNYDKVLQPGQVVVVMSKGQKARRGQTARPLQVEHFTVGKKWCFGRPFSASRRSPIPMTRSVRSGRQLS